MIKIHEEFEDTYASFRNQTKYHEIGSERDLSWDAWKKNYLICDGNRDQSG